MVRFTLRAALAACAVLGVVAAASLSSEKDEGFVPLFNGKDLSGWHKNPKPIGHGTGGRWRVEDGAIVGEQDPPGSGNGGILLTDQKFRDVEVIFECKPDWAEFEGMVGGVCSGFFLRSTEDGKCYQVMIDFHEGGNVGEIYGEGVGGFTNRTFSFRGEYRQEGGVQKLVAIRAEPNQGAKQTPLIKLEDWGRIWKLNDWNEVRARIEGNPPRIQTWINGVKITDFQGDRKIPELGEEGSIAVQVHGGKSWPNGAKTRFRNIRVKKL